MIKLSTYRNSWILTGTLSVWVPGFLGTHRFWEVGSGTHQFSGTKPEIIYSNQKQAIWIYWPNLTCSIYLPLILVTFSAQTSASVLSNSCKVVHSYLKLTRWIWKSYWFLWVRYWQLDMLNTQLQKLLIFKTKLAITNSCKKECCKKPC